MKKFLPFIAFLLILIGCSDDSPEGIQSFEITDKSVDFSAEAQGKEIQITTNLSEWETYIDGAGEAWCSVSPVVNGTKRALIVQVEENKEWDVHIVYPLAFYGDVPGELYESLMSIVFLVQFLRDQGELSDYRIGYVPVTEFVSTACHLSV